MDYFRLSIPRLPIITQKKKKLYILHWIRLCEGFVKAWRKWESVKILKLERLQSGIVLNSKWCAETKHFFEVWTTNRQSKALE